MCSNIDCRSITSGPAEPPDRSINLGEAAHIYGSREGAARYRPDMTDISRAEITNGIWLCRNCHKLVDSDPLKFPADLLFQWRSRHEQYVISKLGTASDQLRLTLEEQALNHFQNDSALVRQIIRDRPDGWEYRLTAELLREQLKGVLRRWSDLQRNLYSKPAVVLTDDLWLAWFRARISEAQRLIPMLVALYTEELARSWGKPGEPGEPGDPLEIRHVCSLIQSAAEQLLQWEENVRFVSADTNYTALFDCLTGSLGMQLDQLRNVPQALDKVTDWIETKPGVAGKFEHTIVFTLPDGWAERIEEAMDRIKR